MDVFDPDLPFDGTPLELATPEKRGGGVSPVLGVVAIVLLAAVGIIGFNLVGGEPEANATSMDSYTTEFLSSAIGPDSPLPPPSADFPHIVYEDGLLYVRGVASGQQHIDEAVARLEAIFGTDSVIPEVVIDPEFVDNPDAATSVYFTENVLFRTGSAEIEPQFFDILGASAAFLQLSSNTTIEITGHTDSDGDEDSNLELSQARVDAAREAMIEQGGDADRITATGLGESEPIADNSTAEGRQQNRRVELKINPDG